jgi:integration host factor subunit alpha
MGTMTKNDLVQGIHDNLGFSKRDCIKMVEHVFEIMKENLSRGDKVKISGFGSFVVKDKDSQRGRNPQTGEEIEITARRVLTFKPSQLLRKELNNH